MPAPPSLEEALLTGLAWMPDGGFASVNHPSWRQNCLAWATETLPQSLLWPLATTSTLGARSVVQQAEAHLAGPWPLPGAWRNHQFVMSRRDGRAAPLVDVSTRSGLAETQRVLDAITAAYGWRRCLLDLMPHRFAGTWRTGRESPQGWPASANDGKVVSFAVTGQQQYCWTEPANNSGLPALSEALC